MFIMAAIINNYWTKYYQRFISNTTVTKCKDQSGMYQNDQLHTGPDKLDPTHVPMVTFHSLDNLNLAYCVHYFAHTYTNTQSKCPCAEFNFNMSWDRNNKMVHYKIIIFLNSLLNSRTQIIILLT